MYTANIIDVLNSGNGGIATSSTSGTTSGDSSVRVYDTAIGGNGGSHTNYSGMANSGGNGGAASSTAIGNNIGSQTVTVNSTAIGGNGGGGYGTGVSGLGGYATSNASATSTAGYANASANATGGNGISLPNLIDSVAFATGGAGSQANATASSTDISIVANTQVNSSVSGSSDSIATIGQQDPLGISASNKEAVAFGAALPQLADMTATLVADPNTLKNFDLGGNSQMWMLGQMGVLNTSLANGLHDYHSTLNLNINTTSITNSQDILLGLINPLLGNNSFLSGNGDSLTFSYTISGNAGSRSMSNVFNSTNIAQASSFFNDNTLNLGALSSYSHNSMLSLVFNLDLQTQVNGAGVDFGMVLGNSTLGSGHVSAVPLPSAVWLFLTGMLGFMGFQKRRHIA